MIAAICVEIKHRKSYLKNEKISSIYFGGGTPSLLDKSEIETILNMINSTFELEYHAEISLEANPDDISLERAAEWKKAGINRLSIGIQSFKQEDLEWMKRTHTMEQSYNAVPIAQKAGFNNLTIDLIYGLPNLTIDEWESHIETAIKLGVNHISAYCLTVENKTELHALVKSGKIIPASEDLQSEQFILLVSKLKANGFEQYEISNFCKPNSEAVHNSNYWKGIHYLGIGPSAHSFNGTSRSWNIRNNKEYIRKINEKELYSETEELTIINQFNELLLTGLRTKYGVELKRIIDFGLELTEFWQGIEQLLNQQLIYQTETHLYLTDHGKLQADKIASDLFQIV
jgi:oxygen-independent coproporphyrinogen-3 oxidase